MYSSTLKEICVLQYRTISTHIRFAIHLDITRSSCSTQNLGKSLCQHRHRQHGNFAIQFLWACAKEAGKRASPHANRKMALRREESATTPLLRGRSSARSETTTLSNYGETCCVTLCFTAPHLQEKIKIVWLLIRSRHL